MVEVEIAEKALLLGQNSVVASRFNIDPNQLETFIEEILSDHESEAYQAFREKAIVDHPHILGFYEDITSRKKAFLRETALLSTARSLYKKYVYNSSKEVKIVPLPIEPETKQPLVKIMRMQPPAGKDILKGMFDCACAEMILYLFIGHFDLTAMESPPSPRMEPLKEPSEQQPKQRPQTKNQPLPSIKELTGLVRQCLDLDNKRERFIELGKSHDDNIRARFEFVEEAESFTVKLENFVKEVTDLELSDEDVASVCKAWSDEIVEKFIICDEDSPSYLEMSDHIRGDIVLKYDVCHINILSSLFTECKAYQLTTLRDICLCIEVDKRGLKGKKEQKKREEEEAKIREREAETLEAQRQARDVALKLQQARKEEKAKLAAEARARAMAEAEADAAAKSRAAEAAAEDEQRKREISNQEALLKEKVKWQEEQRDIKARAALEEENTPLVTSLQVTDAHHHNEVGQEQRPSVNLIVTDLEAARMKQLEYFEKLEQLEKESRPSITHDDFDQGYPDDHYDSLSARDLVRGVQDDFKHKPGSSDNDDIMVRRPRDTPDRRRDEVDEATRRKPSADVSPERNRPNEQDDYVPRNRRDDYRDDYNMRPNPRGDYVDRSYDRRDYDRDYKRDRDYYRDYDRDYYRNRDDSEKYPPRRRSTGEQEDARDGRNDRSYKNDYDRSPRRRSGDRGERYHGGDGSGRDDFDMPPSRKRSETEGNSRANNRDDFDRVPRRYDNEREDYYEGRKNDDSGTRRNDEQQQQQLSEMVEPNNPPQTMTKPPPNMTKPPPNMTKPPGKQQFGRPPPKKVAAGSDTAEADAKRAAAQARIAAAKLKVTYRKLQINKELPERQEFSNFLREHVNLLEFLSECLKFREKTAQFQEQLDDYKDLKGLDHNQILTVVQSWAVELFGTYHLNVEAPQYVPLPKEVLDEIKPKLVATDLETLVTIFEDSFDFINDIIFEFYQEFVTAKATGDLETKRVVLPERLAVLMPTPRVAQSAPTSSPSSPRMVKNKSNPDLKSFALGQPAASASPFAVQPPSRKGGRGEKDKEKRKDRDQSDSESESRFTGIFKRGQRPSVRNRNKVNGEDNKEVSNMSRSISSPTVNMVADPGVRRPSTTSSTKATKVAVQPPKGFTKPPQRQTRGKPKSKAAPTFLDASLTPEQKSRKVNNRKSIVRLSKTMKTETKTTTFEQFLQKEDAEQLIPNYYSSMVGFMLEIKKYQEKADLFRSQSEEYNGLIDSSKMRDLIHDWAADLFKKYIFDNTAFAAVIPSDTLSTLSTSYCSDDLQILIHCFDEVLAVVASVVNRLIQKYNVFLAAEKEKEK